MSSQSLKLTKTKNKKKVSFYNKENIIENLGYKSKNNDNPIS